MTSYRFYVVISQPNCSYCEKAKELLDSKKIPFTNVDIRRSGYLKTLVQMADLQTVPQIFGFDGEYVGGFEELREHLGSK